LRVAEAEPCATTSRALDAIFALHNKTVKSPHMIIIAIAWLYVALMLSIGANSLIGAVIGFLAWGPLPLAIVWYIFGRKRNRPQAPDD
jgi:hypothetical protein